MPTTKTRDRKAAKPPLSIDDCLRDNVAATKKPPAETVAQLSTRHLYLSGKEDLSAELQKGLRDMKKGRGGLRLALPARPPLAWPATPETAWPPRRWPRVAMQRRWASRSGPRGRP